MGPVLRDGADRRDGRPNPKSITVLELPTPAGRDFDTLLGLCHAANKQGHGDDLIMQHAVIMHWQIVWAKNYYTGKFMRSHPFTVSGSRCRPFAHDVRRIHKHLVRRDLAGYTRALVEAPPYVQRLIQSEIKAVARSTDPATVLMWPHIYRALLIRSLDSLMGKNVLKSKPRLVEKDRCGQVLETLWWRLTGEERSRSHTYTGRGAIKGKKYEFMLSVSNAYGFGIVTAHSAHRLRRRKQIVDKMSLQAR